VSGIEWICSRPSPKWSGAPLPEVETSGYDMSPIAKAQDRVGKAIHTDEKTMKADKKN